MVAAATSPSAIFLMIVLLLVLGGKRLSRGVVPEPAARLAAGSKQKLSNKFCRTVEQARSPCLNFRSFSSDAQAFGRFPMLVFLAAQPGLEAIEIKVDHR